MNRLGIVSFWTGAIAMACLVLGHAPGVSADPPFGPPFGAAATGAEEVPPVSTDGLALLQVNTIKHGEAMKFRLLAFRLEDIVQAHLHLGEPGNNGPVVAFLFGPAAPPVTPNARGTKRGQLSNGVLTAEDLLGPLAGEPLETLLEAMRAGDIYLNVHTVQNPGGEVRGQLVRLPDSV